MTGCHFFQSAERTSLDKVGKSRDPAGGESRIPVFQPFHCRIIREDEIVVGEGATEWHEFGHDAELEWCLIFPKPLSELKITTDLECLLQGSIRERVLFPAGSSGGKKQRASGSRSIIAMELADHSGYFAGIPTSLADIHSDKTCSSMRLEYQKENRKGSVSRVVSSSVLARKDLVSSLRNLQEREVGNTRGSGNAVRLHALCCHGGYIQERWLKYQSALTAVKGVHYTTIAESTIRSRLMSDVIERREYIQRGTSAKLMVLDADGNCVGSSVLKVL